MDGDHFDSRVSLSENLEFKYDDQGGDINAIEISENSCVLQSFVETVVEGIRDFLRLLKCLNAGNVGHWPMWPSIEFCLDTSKFEST